MESVKNSASLYNFSAELKPRGLWTLAWVSGLPKGLGERRFSLPFSLSSFPFSPETPDTQASELRISSDRDDRMGAKSKPKKIPWLNFILQKIPCEFPSHNKNFQKALNDITRKIETLVLNTQKTLLKTLCSRSTINCFRFFFPSGIVKTLGN